MATEENEEVIGWRGDDAGGRNNKYGGWGWGWRWEWEMDSRLGITSTLVCMRATGSEVIPYSELEPVMSAPGR